MYFKLTKNASTNQFHWALYSANNQIICWSEGYTTRESALHSIALVKAGAFNAPIY